MPVHVQILRDPRESPRKCSLTPLRGLERIDFLEYRPERRLDARGRVLLHHEGPPLEPGEAPRDLLLVDSSWRRLPSLLAIVEGDPEPRSLPPLVTAYPRSSKTFEDPGAGLASVEALFAALLLMGEHRPELLADYRFAEAFLAANPVLRGLLPGPESGEE